MKTILVKPTSNSSFSSYWLQFNKDSELPDPMLVYKEQLTNIHNFALGNSYWMIASIPETKVVAAGGALEEMTGISGDLWPGSSPESCLLHFHPDDIPYIFTYIIEVHQYLLKIPLHERKNIKASIYAKRIADDGSIQWYCGQIPSFISDKDGNLIYFLAVWSDISHLKSGISPPFLSILNTSDGVCKTLLRCNPGEKLEKPDSLPVITKREQEIIHCLTKGLTSKQIADDLNIAKNTVDNHRQNILRKMSVSSTAEIIAISLKNGLI